MNNLWENDLDLYQIKNQIEKMKVISFDIFDTLLLRTVTNPKDLFLELGAHAKKKGLFIGGTTKHEFQQIRILAEELARKRNREYRNNGEVTLDEIYTFFPENFHIEAIKRLEIELEKEVCYLNPIILSLIEHCFTLGKDIYLISDMYLSRRNIEEILVYNGFNLDQIKEIYVSSEYKLTKYEGTLLREIKNILKVSGDNWIHIGDNELADVRQPKKLGINSILYNPRISNSSFFQYENIMYGNLLPEIYNLRKVISRLTSSYVDVNDKLVYNLGISVIGPFLATYAEWILDIAEKENIKQIRPFMREGILLEKVLKQTAKKRNLDLDIRCLYVSREATTFPKGKVVEDKNYISTFFDNSRRGLTVKDFFDKFHYELPSEYIEFSEVEMKDTSKVVINNTTLEENLKKILLSEETNLVIDNQKKNFVNYLIQNINIAEPFITVDIGFRGTIQENIDNILRDNNLSFNSIHLMAIGSEQVKYKLQKGHDIRGFVASAGENLDIVKPIIKEPSIIEQLHMDETGSTLFYKLDSNKVVKPILDNNNILKDEIAKKKICQKGVLDFNLFFLDLIGKKKNIKEKILNNKRQLAYLITRLYTLPTYGEAKFLLNLQHDENFGSKNIVTLNNKEIRNLFQSLGTDEFLKYAKFNHIAWPEGIITVERPNDLFYKSVMISKFASPYILETIQLAKMLNEKRVQKVIIYGAGEVGRTLLEALCSFDIDVVAYIDNNEFLWGDTIENVKILSITQARSLECKTIIIASFAFVDEIRQSIYENFIDIDIYEINKPL